MTHLLQGMLAMLLGFPAFAQGLPAVPPFPYVQSYAPGWYPGYPLNYLPPPAVIIQPDPVQRLLPSELKAQAQAQANPPPTACQCSCPPCEQRVVSGNSGRSRKNPEPFPAVELYQPRREREKQSG